MQRVRLAVVRDGPLGRRERLRQQLAAIHAAFALRRFRRREVVRPRLHQGHHAHESAGSGLGHYEWPNVSRLSSGWYSSSR